MRKIEEIKADIANVKAKLPEGHTNTDLCELEFELRNALTFNIPLERLEELCQGEQKGVVCIFPCKAGDIINQFSWTASDGTKIRSDTVTKVVPTKSGFTIYTKKMFRPIKTAEYDIAPVSEYPNALADFYIVSSEEVENAVDVLKSKGCF